MFTKDDQQQAHDLIDHVFEALLPLHGMPTRPAQLELSHRMLDTMLDGRIALCDAGTGIGKTFSYLVAGVAFTKYRASKGLVFQPIIISTSSIALQRAVLGEYLPFLSRILWKAGVIPHPLQAVVRKGKAHYVCDERLERRLRKVSKKKNAAASAALLSLREHLDLDEAPRLSDYDREKVCVPQFCDCHRKRCRYFDFILDCNRDTYQFQICNHNLLLADAIHQEQNRQRILPKHSALVIDEAHKLPEAARQMFGVTLCADDIEDVIRDLRSQHYILAAESLTNASRHLEERLAKPGTEAQSVNSFSHMLSALDRCLQAIQTQVGDELPPASAKRLAALSSGVSLFCEKLPEMVYYLAPDEKGGAMLCATAVNLPGRLQSSLWSQSQGMILTSATMAVGSNFHHYKGITGLLTIERVTESVALSPFNYQQNCLMYLSEHPPRFRKKNYYEKMTGDVTLLLKAAHGHALILFTSYASMAAVRSLLKGKVPYPLFVMGRNALHTTEQFKSTPGAVLLAAGPAWEGFDFPGDCVSLVVIPRLPFSYPDPLKEREREDYETLPEFIQAVAVPEMQIKLKQGFGRAIRTETDTCVIAILDERATPEGRYFAAVTEALPEMPMTRSLQDVEKFMRSVKGMDYFRDGLV